MKKPVVVITTLLVLTALSPLSYAQTNGGQRARMRQVLAAACSGKAPDAPCTFTRRDGSTMKGTCVSTRSELLCMTKRMQKRMEERMHGMNGGGMGGAPSTP
jgi:hypothetical protein